MNTKTQKTGYEKYAERLSELQTNIKGIIERADSGDRDLTDDEIARVEVIGEEAKEVKRKLDASQETSGLLARISAVAGDDPYPDGESSRKTRAGGGRRAWAKAASENVRRLTRNAGVGGQKSLISGSVSVPAIVSPNIIDSRPTHIIDLVVTGATGGSTSSGDDIPSTVGRPSEAIGNGFSYIRQNARTNNAAAVPDGENKPTSNYTFGQVDDRFRVYANKTEDLPFRYLTDYEYLIDVVRAQLVDDTLAAMEADMLAGTGEGDAFTGILNTEGTQRQPFETDLLTTLSAAKYALLGQDRNLTGWAMNPTDLRVLEMLRENGTSGAFLFKSREEIEGFVGAPIVASTAIAAGTAIAADWSQANLIPFGDDELVVDTKKRTDNNTFLLMYEGRYGFRVTNPFDFVQVTLAETAA